MKTTFLVIISTVLSALLVFTSCENAEYKSAIEKGDQLYKAKKYTPAKTNYTKALKISPDEEYPKQQIEKIDKILDKLAKQKAIADAKKYESLIGEADKLFQDKAYREAKNAYQKALNIKAGEEHPKNRLAEINQILKEIEEMKNNPYHIVLGCFEVDKNAVNFHEKIKNEFNQHSRSFPLGRLDAVTYKSYPTLTAAYNDLPEAKKISENAWVMKK